MTFVYIIDIFGLIPKSSNVPINSILVFLLPF